MDRSHPGSRQRKGNETHPAIGGSAPGNAKIHTPQRPSAIKQQPVFLRDQYRKIFESGNHGTDSRANLDGIEPTRADRIALLDSIRHYFPGIEAQEKNIISQDAGVRPLARPSKRTKTTDISREHRIRRGPSGVYHVAGVKLTDHRRAAEEVVDRLVPDLRKRNPHILKRSLTDRTPL